MAFGLHFAVGPTFSRITRWTWSQINC